MKKTVKLMSILSVIWILVLCMLFSYSWVARNWTPSLAQERISIASTGSLVIGLSDDTTHNSVNLNDLISEDAFSFKQVSSAEGVVFYTVDFLPVLDDEPPIFTNEIKDRFIEVDFYLKTQPNNDSEINFSKYVFIHPETFISDDSPTNVSDAIRIGITVDGVNNNKPFILGNTGNTNEAVVGAIAADTDALDKPLYEDHTTKEKYNPDATTHQMVYDLHYFNGGRPADAAFDDYDFTVNPERMMFTIGPGEIKHVNLKIWLEGGDENCVDEIAGEVFSILLKFDSMEIKPTE